MSALKFIHLQQNLWFFKLLFLRIFLNLICVLSAVRISITFGTLKQSWNSNKITLKNIIAPSHSRTKDSIGHPCNHKNNHVKLLLLQHWCASCRINIKRNQELVWPQIIKMCRRMKWYKMRGKMRCMKEKKGVAAKQQPSLVKIVKNG